MKRISCAIFGMLLLAAIPAAGESLTDGLEGVTVVDSVHVTGFNRFLSEPLWNVGVLGTVGFNWVYGYNPGGDTALPLTAESPLDTVMASGIDLSYISFFGLDPEDIDPSLVNVPLHEMPVIDTFSGGRSQLPSVFDVSGATRSRNFATAPITLEDWLAAEGRAFLLCTDDDQGWIRLEMSNLIPSGLYYVVGLFTLAGSAFDAVPLGGVPALFVADITGKAEFFRRVNFCPTDPTAAERLLVIQIEYHSDGAAYGAAPHQAQATSPTPTGITSHAQLAFPINVTPVQ